MATIPTNVTASHGFLDCFFTTHCGGEEPGTHDAGAVCTRGCIVFFKSHERGRENKTVMDP